MNAVANAPWDFNKAQEALQKWAGQNPYERTFFALDMATGEEPAVIETGSGGFCQDPAPPPLVRPDGSVLAMHYSKMGAMQKPMKFGGWGDRPEAVWDWSVVNFQTGKFECLGPTDSADHPNAIVRYDDLYQCTMAGDYLYSLHHGGRAGMAPIQRNIGPLFDMNCVYPLGERGIAYLYGRCWIGCVSWTILPDVVLANTTGGAYIIALESAR